MTSAIPTAGFAVPQPLVSPLFSLSVWLAPTSPLRLHPLDLAIVLFYLVGITLFGLHFRGSEDKSLRGYFLAGRTIPWWAIGLSIVSAETSTLTIISIPGVAYAGDMGFLQVVFGYMIGRIVVALLFLPRYFGGEMLTAYQLIDQRFGHTLHKVTAGLFLLTRAAAEGVRVFAVSIVVGIAIGTGDVLSIAIISALTLLYTFEGGMAAVIWTDVVQMGIYVAGTAIALVTLGSHVTGGWSTIHTVGAAAGKFQVLHFALDLSQSYTFWAGVLGGTFLTMASHGTDQLMVQRMLAARNLAESRLALLSSGVVIFLQFTLFLLIGIGLFVFYGQHPQALSNYAGTAISPDRLFPTFIVREMPVGVAGLLVAAILAAAMSNLSAALNSLSSTTVVDFYMHWRPQADSDDRQRARVSRGSTVLWAAVLFAIAVYAVHVGGKGHVVEVGLSIASVAYGSLLGVFLLGTLTRYATQSGAIVGMIAGFSLNLLLWLHPGPFVLGPVTTPHVAFTWYVLIGSAVTFLVGSLASFIPSRSSRAARIAAALLLSAACLPLHLHAQAVTSTANQPSPDFSPIDRLMADALAAKKLPGAVIQVGHGGSIVFEKAYGNRSEDPTVEPMTTDTIFDMASLTKCLATATAVMQLYEQGKLGFDDPIAKYLPAFTSTAPGQSTDPRRAEVTVRMLLTHTSGEAPDVDLRDRWGLATPDKEEGIRRALTTPLQSAPASIFRYSDINFILLGDLVETLSGQPLETYAAEHIFTPLGMTQTGFHPFARTCGPVTRIGANVEPGPKPIGYIRLQCLPGPWSPLALHLLTAPTAHDTELTAAQNPDFDHMLRGTVHDPTTRRMGGVAGQAGVFSTTRDIGLYAQALLDRLAGRPSTFPLKQSTLELMTSPQQPGHSPLGPAHNPDLTQIPAGTTVTYPSRKGHDIRGFGWDIDTAYSRPRGVVFPIGSFGHTGFTGTTLWMDPGSDTYVVLLANAVHPRGRPAISGLRGDVATAAARALNLYPERRDATAVPPPAATHAAAVFTGPVLTGIDVLEATHFAALSAIAARHGDHLRLGLLSNAASLDAGGRRTADILLHTLPGITLTILYSPEHGLSTTQDTEHLAAETDTATHLPLVNLYGTGAADRHPALAQFANIDALVVDLQDSGVRFWTYETLLGYVLETLVTSPVEIVVLDRPNPTGGVAVEGPTSVHAHADYTNYTPLPLRHGLTFGELARLFRAQSQAQPQSQSQPQACGPGPCSILTVVPMQNWRRSQFFEDTQLTWTPPSPNLRTPPAAILYPAIGLTEQTNISVGRGSPNPFENLGAPFIDAPQLAAYLSARNIPGVIFAPGTLTVAETPERYPSHGQTVPAIHFTVVDRTRLDTPELGVEILAALHTLYPKQFNLGRAAHLMANPETMQALERGEDPRTIAAAWTPDLQAFRARRQPFLLYP